MSSEREDRGDSTTGGGEDERDAGVEGTHGGLAIGRTTGMGAGIAKGGTPGAGESGGVGESGGPADEGTGGGDETGG
jgi:hypothetical protein